MELTGEQCWHSKSKPKRKEKRSCQAWRRTRREKSRCEKKKKPTSEWEAAGTKCWAGVGLQGHTCAGTWSNAKGGRREHTEPMTPPQTSDAQEDETTSFNHGVADRCL